MTTLILFDCSMSADGNLHVAADCALEAEGWLMDSRAGVCGSRFRFRSSLIAA